MEMSGRLKPIVMQVERGRISAMEQKLIGIHRRRDQSAKACLNKFVDEQAVAVMPPLGWLVQNKNDCCDFVPAFVPLWFSGSA